MPDSSSPNNHMNKTSFPNTCGTKKHERTCIWTKGIRTWISKHVYKNMFLLFDQSGIRSEVGYSPPLFRSLEAATIGHFIPKSADKGGR